MSRQPNHGQVNQCTAMRWRIPGFLNGDLPAEMMDEVRQHLDICVDCAIVLAHPARVESADISNTPQLSPDFAERLMATLPTSFTGRKLAGFVALAFFFSGVFGVGIWAGIKRILGSTHELISASGSVPGTENGGLLHSLFSAASLQYVALGALAVVVCLVVIAVVDRPRTNRETAHE